MDNKGTYDSRLYRISKEICIEKNSDFSNDQSLPIHNSLQKFLKLLTGQYSPYKESVKYTLPILDLNSVSDNAIKKLFEFYLDYMRNPDAESNVRKAKSNYTKIDLTYDTQLTDEVMRQAERELGEDVFHGKNNVEFYKKFYAYFQQTVRLNIANWEKEYRRSLDRSSLPIYLRKLLIFRRSSFNKIILLDEYKEMENSFSIWRNHYRSLLYIDISCWIILQTVGSFLQSKKFEMNIETIQRLCRELDDTSPVVKPVKCSENIFLTFSEFLLFSVFRTHFLEDIILLKNLSETCTDMQNPSREYSLIDDNGKQKIISKEQRYYFFLEGEEKYKRSFNINIKKCEEFITLFNKESGRNLQLNDITLKAVYRQLMLEKTVRNKRQSKTIINDFLKKGKFNNLAEYYFINEKINMGMYREHGLLNEFLVKNDFQEKLYTLVNILLTQLDPTIIFSDAQKIFDNLYSILEDAISENKRPASIKDIEEFLSTINFCSLDEPMPRINDK